MSVQSSHYKIFVLCETGLTDTIFDTEIFDDNFVVYRCDRSILSSNKTRKGGVLIAVHSSIKSSLLKSGFEVGLEHVWVSASYFKTTINLGVLYVVPNADISLYQSHIDFATEIVDSLNGNNPCYVFGDFNLPNLKWSYDEESNAYLLPVNVASDVESCVVDRLFALDLLQINDVKNDNDRLLDLLFTNNYLDTSVEIASHRLLPDEIHHRALEISVNIAKLINNISFESETYKINFKQINISVLIHFFLALTGRINLWTQKLNRMQLISTILSLRVLGCMLLARLIKERNHPFHGKIKI